MRQVTAQDSGVYRCSASSSAGSAERHMKLEVRRIWLWRQVCKRDLSERLGKTSHPVNVTQICNPLTDLWRINNSYDVWKGGGVCLFACFYACLFVNLLVSVDIICVRHYVCL